jgi:hypothetical protein
MAGDKLRFQVVMVEGSFRASCLVPPISAEGARLVSLRANVAAAIGAALGEPRPFSLMVGARPPPPAKKDENAEQPRR